MSRREKWATRRWLIAWRLFGAVPDEEADRYLQERNEWRQRISDALGITWQELHGGGATVYADLARCIEEIGRLKHERSVGWQAAYDRGREDERDARAHVRATSQPIPANGAKP